MVTLKIDENEVKRVMIYTGSLIDLLYYETFKKIDILEDKLLPIEELIKGFIRALAYPFTKVRLSVKFEKRLQ